MDQQSRITFNPDIAELPYPAEDILQALGHSFKRQPIENLPHAETVPEYGAELAATLEKNQSSMPMTSETAKRETLISPVLQQVSRLLDLELLIEYPMDAGPKLHGTVDYCYRHPVLVIEAKRADLDQGFKRLAAELIAAAHWFEQSAGTVYGAVTTGNLWLFGSLRVSEKQIVRHEILQLNSLPKILQILHGALA